MKLFLKISLVAGILWPLILGILVVLIQIPQPISTQPSTYYSPTIAIFFFISFCISLVFLIRLYKSYRITLSNRVLPLLLFLFFSGLTSLQAGFFSLITFTPVHFGKYWNALTELLLYPGILFLGIFNLEVFHKDLNHKRKDQIVIFLVIYLFLLEIMTTIAIFIDEFPQILISSLIFVVFNFCFYDLSKSAFQISKKTPDKTQQIGFKLIGIAGMFYILAFLFNMVFNIYLSFDAIYLVYAVFAFATTLIGNISLYFGFTYPMKRKENLKEDLE